MKNSVKFWNGLGVFLFLAILIWGTPVIRAMVFAIWLIMGTGLGILWAILQADAAKYAFAEDDYETFKDKIHYKYPILYITAGGLLILYAKVLHPILKDRIAEFNKYLDGPEKEDE